MLFNGSVKKCCSIAVMFAFLGDTFISSQCHASESRRRESTTLPGGEEVVPTGPISPKSGNEYFSSNPNYKILMPVHVWGEVNSPGIHYLPVGTSMSLAISAAGGPKADASLPDIRLNRGDTSRDIDLYDLGPKTALQQNDSIIVRTSAKKDLPLIFSTISTVISIITLTVILRRN
jgi:hypothetical protein